MEHWFISDTHFSHKRIIDYSNRPFSSIEEHDEILIENWNNDIKNGDNVYFLGDFCFGNKETALRFRKRLSGNIHFIEGNHDNAARQIRDTFIWYKPVWTIKIDKQEIFLSHYAHRVWNKSHYGTYMCYGHSHSSLPDDIHALSMDVGVDATAARLSSIPTGQFPQLNTTLKKDYRPINFYEVKQFMARKIWKPVDHHISE